MTRPMILDVTAEVAGHIAVALRLHRDWAARAGMLVPSELEQVHQALAKRARQGQRGTPIEDLWEVRHRDHVAPRLVTYADAGRMLACSQRTIKRLVAAGHLTPVHIGGAARLRITDIDAYIAASASGGSEGETAC